MRRAVPADFPRIWNLVDEVWNRSRPREAYQWLYEKNPCGIARATVVFEVSSGELVSASSRFPWPVACGDERLWAEFGGDAVTLPRLQRTGLTPIRRGPGTLNPLRDSMIVLAAPNEKSRANARKQGDVTPLGPLPSMTLVLDYQRYLAGRGVPRPMATAAGGVANAAHRQWLHRALPAPTARGALRVVTIEKFDSAADAVTQRCMRTDRYWCPHDYEFLNWRYFDHVLVEYVAVGLLLDDQIVAYAVASVSDRRSLLMEFAVEPTGLASTLLLAIIDRVRQAGCDRIDFYSTSGWRHWPLLKRAGFRPRPSQRYIKADCVERPDVPVEANWQLLPSDSDVT